jgi:hypothetical protein
MESKIKSMKQMTFADNVNWIMKGPPQLWPPSPIDFFESLKFVETSGTFFQELSALLARPRKNQNDLSSEDKNNLNSALDTAIRDDQYQKIAAIHADKTTSNTLYEWSSRHVEVPVMA